MDVTVVKLAQLGLLAGLDKQALAEIAPHVRVYTFEPGQDVALAGEPCSELHIVVSGTIRARRLSLEGREYVLDYILPGQALNLASALDDGTNLASGEALTPTTTYAIPCERFRQFVHGHPSVAAAALTQLSSQVRQLSDTVEDLALHTVRARLARFLLTSGDGQDAPSRHWTQEEIAAHIGTVRDVVGRTLRVFGRSGLIRRERGRLVITDRDGLEEEAQYI
jgi:CRP/FNR family cyclic AMP-dependent transcriptional regulator